MNEKRNFDYKRLHPFKWYILENFPFLEDSIDVLTNYQLFCKLGEMYNKQVDAINTLGIQVEDITDWFDDLDVQEEINNKLDEMAESGELEEIIASYLNTKAIICFDTLSDMKLSENLVDGSYAQTLGYYVKNDGGKALYKIRTITNNDIVDEGFIVELADDTLIAELIVSDEINVNQYGLKANDSTIDNSTKLIALINKCNSKGLNIKFSNGIYYFSNSVTITDRLDAMIISGNGQYYYDYNETTQASNSGTLLVYSGDDYLFNFNRLWKSQIKDLTISCTNGGSGFDFKDIFFYSTLKNITISNAYNGIMLEAFAYAFIEDVNVSCFSPYTPNIGLQVGKSGNTCEYLFLKNYISEFNNQSGTGILIKKGIHFKMENLDIVQMNKGILIDPVEQCNWFDVNFVDFARCHIALDFNPASYYIVGGSFNNIVINFKESPESDDEGIIFRKTASYNTNSMEFKNIVLRALSGNPTYGINETVANAIFNVTIDVLSNTTDIPLKLLCSVLETMPLVRNVRPLNWNFKSFNTSATSLTFKLFTKSPFVDTPMVVVTDKKNLISTYAVSNTHGGDMILTVTLSGTQSTGNEYYVSIPNASYQQSSGTDFS